MKFTKFTGSFNYPVGLHMPQNIKNITHLRGLLLLSVNEITPITFWCRGSSGAIIASILSIPFTHCIINHVKKNGESSHSNGVSVPQGDRINIIVDDFMGTGSTLNAIYESMRTYGIDTVDYLCIGETVSLYYLKFEPLHIISETVISKSFNILHS